MDVRLRYEIRDSKTPGRGMRFTSLDRALKELEAVVGEPGRWELVDRRDDGRLLLTAP